MTIPYKRILVPLDGSEFAAFALPHAESLASHLGASLVLAQVVPSAATMAVEASLPSTGIGMPTIDPYLVEKQFESVESELINNAAATLNDAATRLREKVPQVETLVLSGSPAEAIVTYAQSEQIDLIVMSTHGRSGLSRLVYGSVAERILHQSTCPVLLVRIAATN
jgi:nucleotide-binding universal stress UspA family protein